MQGLVIIITNITKDTFFKDEKKEKGTISIPMETSLKDSGKMIKNIQVSIIISMEGPSKGSFKRDRCLMG